MTPLSPKLTLLLYYRLSSPILCCGLHPRGLHAKAFHLSKTEILQTCLDITFHEPSGLCHITIYHVLPLPWNVVAPGFFSYLAPPVLSNVVEAIDYFREVRCLVQECLEVLHRVFLREIQ